LGVDFDSDLGKLQRLMAESIAGTTRRNAILNEMQIQVGDTIVDVGCGAGHLLTHLAKAVGDSGTIYGLILAKPSLDKPGSGVQNLKILSTLRKMQTTAS
jgi:cyclopropane fatty-acyl-phospholipid synthase-like methyltransferase